MFFYKTFIFHYFINNFIIFMKKKWCDRILYIDDEKQEEVEQTQEEIELEMDEIEDEFDDEWETEDLETEDDLDKEEIY